jgi:3-oxoacyl-[acyl-carrier protein] reductase
VREDVVVGGQHAEDEDDVAGAVANEVRARGHAQHLSVGVVRGDDPGDVCAVSARRVAVVVRILESALHFAFPVESGRLDRAKIARPSTLLTVVLSKSKDEASAVRGSHTMNLDLTGKVAIVTGASRGIGRAIAKTLAHEGMRLALVARSLDQLKELASELETISLVQALDLSEPDAADRVVAETVAYFGSLDLLVNNAGATKRGDFLELSDEDWNDGFRLKFFGAMRCSRAAWPHLAASHGAIVNIVGIGGRTGSADFAIGGSVNAAVLNLTKALADRGVADGVRVNAINPGSIATERLKGRLLSFAADQGIDVERAEHDMARAFRIARFGQPEEIAQVVAFLASAQASYCQGAVVDVDGGATRTL